MAKCSTLFYRTLDGVAETLELPTIQSLNIPDCSTIPSRPTITGEYRNQYVSQASPKISFTLWLENERYGNDTMDVAEIVDKLTYLRDHRIKFNLTTTHEAEESKFLSDLIIENISFNRDATRRGRLVAVVNCVKIKLIDLNWKQASAIEIFGQNIFTETNIDATRSDFIPASVDADFEISLDFWQRTKKTTSVVLDDVKNVAGLSGTRDLPTNLLIKDQIENKINLDPKSLYFKLASPIDLATGSRTYNCKCSFQTGYGLGSAEKMYNVDVLDVTISTVQKECNLTDCLSLAYFKLDKFFNALEMPLLLSPVYLAADLGLKEKHYRNYGITGSIYNFADTYVNFPLSKTFEHIENSEELSKFMKDVVENGTYSDDDNTLRNGNVIIKDSWIYTYHINDRYEYTIKIGDTFSETITPAPDLRVDVFTLTTSSHGFKPIVSSSKYQEIWDNRFKAGDSVYYSIDVVCINLGTLVQVYLFSSNLFNNNNINNQ